MSRWSCPKLSSASPRRSPPRAGRWWSCSRTAARWRSPARSASFGCCSGWRCTAVTWFLGTETGHAVADILFGAEGPSARLPVSFPQASGQEPYHYAHKATGRPNPDGPLQPYKARYRGIANRALFPFGHGLTYGDVVYSAPTGGDGTLAWDGALTLGATLTNRGARAADEVAQLYVHDVAASVTRPVRELKGFRRVRLAPGASARVEFTLTRRDLLFTGAAMRPTVEPGAFRFWIAPSAEAEGVGGVFELGAGLSARHGFAAGEKPRSSSPAYRQAGTTLP